MNRLSKFTIASTALTLAVVSIAGCSVGKLDSAAMLSKLKLPGKQEKSDLPKSGPTKVVTDATALVLELPESDLHARSRFGQRFASLLDEDRSVAADRLTARHPDHAYELLTTSTPDGSDTQIALAAAYDRYCQSAGQWSAVAQGHRNEAVQSYYTARSQWMGNVTNGAFAKTNAIDLVAVAESTAMKPLVVDAWYQTGIGALLRESNAESASAFRRCATEASTDHGLQAATATMLASEAMRRDGDFAGATQAWMQSVALACEQLRDRHISDAAYWERAAYLQPVGTPWPIEVANCFVAIATSSPNVLRTDLIQQLANVVQSSSTASSTPISSACWVETAAGSWQQARGETQKALIHLKKAETQSPPAAAVDWLRITQADLLVSLAQNGTATTILAPIISREDNSPTMHAAMAKLGVMKLKTKSPQHGIRLLKESVDAEHANQWPGKASARADYALGLLMIGDETAGLWQLTLAQQEFEIDRETELLAKSLWNQWQYLKHSDASKQDIEAARTRLNTLQL